MAKTDKELAVDILLRILETGCKFESGEKPAQILRQIYETLHSLPE